MRLTALALLGALSIFAVGCATEDTTGDKASRPSIGEHKGSDDSSDDGTTGAASENTGGGDVAKPITPADPPATTDTKPAAQVVKPIACATVEDSVTQSYRVALQRDPDPGGLQNWVSIIQGGETRLGVLDRILQSQEFASVNANLTDDEFVSLLYQSFFSRNPDDAGRQGWLNALSGGQSRATVAQAFANSDEFKDPNSNRATACYF